MSCRKRKVTQEKERILITPNQSCVDQNRNSSNLRNIDDEEFNDSVALMRSITETIENDSKNVSERLRLKFKPRCLFNLKRCRKIHSSKLYELQIVASYENQYLSRSLIEEERYSQFIYFVGSMCGQRVFPGSEILLGIFEILLKNNDPAIHTHSLSPKVLSDLQSLFINIVNTFPTCQMRKEYLKMLQQKFHIPGINSSPENGILHTMLEILYDLLHHRPDGPELNQKTSLGADALNNFYLWDAEYEKKLAFTSLSREVRLERIFTVLDLLVCVLESDLAIFISKLHNKLSSRIFTSQYCPLICSIMWQKHESVLIINNTLKKIISITVNLIALNYPPSMIQVMTRLLNVISHVSNLYEYQNYSLEYPQYKNITLDLVREIQKTIEKSAYYSMDLYLRVIEYIRSPLIQMLLSDQKLQKINNVQQPVSLQVPFECIRTKKFRVFKDVETIQETYETRYPTVNPKKNVKKCEVTQKGYLKLLLIYAKSLISYYSIKESLKKFKNRNREPEAKKGSSMIERSSLDSIEANKIDLNEKVELRGVDLKFKNQVHIRMSLESYGFYHNQLKYMLLLKKLVELCHSKYGEKFNSFLTLVQTFEQ